MVGRWCAEGVDAELAVLQEAYGDLAEIAVGLDEAGSWQPTGCAGWAVRDLVLHLLTDAWRALVALGTPAPGPADQDAVTYWTGVPAGTDADSRGLRAVRTSASAWQLAALTTTYAEATGAVLVLAARAPDDALVATQGHVLRVPDLVATLAVEAAVHHLDLVQHLDRPGPGAAPLALVRHTLEGLLGRPAPASCSDTRWALAATGRRPLNDEERDDLGSDADRLPLLT